MDEGVGAVWGVGRAEVGRPGTHLVFECGEAAYVVDAALFVEGGDGFGPDLLAMSGADGLDGQGALDGIRAQGVRESQQMVGDLREAAASGARDLSTKGGMYHEGRCGLNCDFCDYGMDRIVDGREPSWVRGFVVVFF